MLNIQRLRLNVLVTVATINTVTDFEGNYNGVNSPNYRGGFDKMKHYSPVQTSG